MKTHPQLRLLGFAICYRILACNASPLTAVPISIRTEPIVQALGDLSSRPARGSKLCDAAELGTLNNAIQDLKLLTAAAAKVLLTPGASQTDPVRSYLGDISDNDLASIVQLRYTNVQNFYPSGTIKTKTDIDDNNVMWFWCPAGQQNLEVSECLQKEKGVMVQNSFAVNNNVGVGEALYSSIALCPKFFTGRSLRDEVNVYRRSGGTNSFDIPTTPALSPEDKLKNAESFALLAFLAYADPDRFRQAPTISREGPTSRESGQTSTEAEPDCQNDSSDPPSVPAPAAAAP
ncbi:hypothetical protein DFH09DRAFT_1100704 [Mycena vulgaris]|nr:hypothetical protein DFH09DRAFT_1100704 [Mycena vulgaris]